MAITGNKGEWSEIYALFKLLGDGQIYAGDENLNIIPDIVYPIISIIRQEARGSYYYSPRQGDIVICSSDGGELLRLSASKFMEQAELLLCEIRCNKGAFALPEVESFMHTICCDTLKAKSTDKTDIRIILHDARTKINSELGFSIKSRLGSDSTLLNASEATNFTFAIKGCELSDEEILHINSISSSKNKVIQRYNAIVNMGCFFEFISVENPSFATNLRMLDGDMEHILADLLILQLEEGVSSIQKLVSILSERNPLKIASNNAYDVYSYKIKHLLTASALGMMPSKMWTGRYDANGGYLVVKEDGDVVCYHFYDRNRFEDYLFYNSYLERSSTSKHKYAIIYEENQILKFKLNLQIRLK